MTSYETEADYIKDQLSSYRKAKKILKDYKLKQWFYFWREGTIKLLGGTQRWSL